MPYKFSALKIYNIAIQEKVLENFKYNFIVFFNHMLIICCIDYKHNKKNKNI